MLRLPRFELAEPGTVEEAVALAAEHGDRARIMAGGTDLLPNMKHELVTPKLVIALHRIAELRGIRPGADDTLAIGSLTSLDAISRDPQVARWAPALSQAASVISGPQLRRMGTLGGNVMLDTRCQWYNQTYFWRSALGFCLKKDGSACHVVAGGTNCVAAASNDTAPALMSLDAVLVFAGPDGRRQVRVEELYTSNGIHNKRTGHDVLVEVRIPVMPAGHRGAYGKLRDRGSIDFPQLGVAARLDLDDSERVLAATLCVVALQARPVRLTRATTPLLGVRVGTPEFRSAADHAATLAYTQCRPLANIPGDAAYRHAMVPVFVRRTVQAAAEGAGPVQAA